MTPQRRLSCMTATAIGVVCAVVLTSCTGGRQEPHTDPGSATSGPATTLDPDFYTWQQARTYTGDKAKIAATVHAADYYGELPYRPGGGVPPELRTVTSQSMYNVLIADSAPENYYPAFPRFRGRVTTRLITINAGRKHVVAVWCQDYSAMEVRSAPDERWKPRGDGYTEYRRRFVVSSSSPTGWRMARSVRYDSDTKRCQKAFKNQAPATSTTGPPALPGGS